MVEISIIIPLQDYEHMEECITGILNQSFHDFEVIFIDLGSSDKFLDILINFFRNDKRFKVFSQKNQGLGIARYEAITRSLGQYIFFVETDEVLCDGTLERAYDYCQQSNADFLFLKPLEHVKGGPSMMDSAFSSLKEKAFTLDDVGGEIFDISVGTLTKFFNRNLVDDSALRSGNDLTFSENKLFWDILLNSKRMIFLDEVAYDKRQSIKSYNNSTDTQNFNALVDINEVFEIFKKHDKFDGYMQRLYNWKVQRLYSIFESSQEEHKLEFKEKLKEEFLKMNEDKDISQYLSEKNIIIYESCINSNSCEEFSLEIKKYELNNELMKLNEENYKLSSQLDESRAKNRELLNSTSWKITSSLRRIRNIKK